MISKIQLVLAAVVLLLCSYIFLNPKPAEAGLVSFMQGQFMEEVQPDVEYTLDTAGYNIRVYEWTPQTAPGHVCVASFTNTGPVGQQCFERTPDE